MRPLLSSPRPLLALPYPIPMHVSPLRKRNPSILFLSFWCPPSSPSPLPSRTACAPSLHTPVRASVLSSLCSPPLAYCLEWSTAEAPQGAGSCSQGPQGLPPSGWRQSRNRAGHAPRAPACPHRSPTWERRKGGLGGGRRGTEGRGEEREGGKGGEGEGDLLGDLVLVQLRDVLDREAAARALVHLRSKEEGRREEGQGTELLRQGNTLESSGRASWYEVRPSFDLQTKNFYPCLGLSAKLHASDFKLE